MPDLEPVHLQQDLDTGDRFLIYDGNSGVQIEVNYEGGSFWMSQAQIAELFGRDRSTITKHIINIFDDGELDEESSVQKLHKTLGRPVARYSLDMVISVGYRVASKQATMFRRWATEKLVQFATKGFVIDAARLKDPANRDRIAELKEIIRDIRSDEANVYRELRQICAMCQDYNGSSEEWQKFYRDTQAKIIFAVTSNTPAEILKGRANSNLANMGLTNWPNANIRKSDVSTSKNYLGASEVKELNRLTVILLDIFEDQLDIGRLKLMAEADMLLDAQLQNLNRVVLRGGGTVSMVDAKRHAEREYAKFKEAQKVLRNVQADETIAEIRNAQKSIEQRKH